MLRLVLGILVLSMLSDISAEQARHGMLRESGGVPQAWDSAEENWVSVKDFWLSYAKGRGGLTWGERTDYPPYGEVKEHDTLIIVLESGPCLMEFFHTRWRRANDVRRWDPGFNEYGGCPHVFD